MQTFPFNCQVLVVEDSDEDFGTALTALSNTQLKCQLHRAHTGEQCLGLLRGANGSKPLYPSFILMDGSTPGLDGHQALQAIKADIALKKIPVVMLSTSSNQHDLTHCYALGANAYHLKPFAYPEHVAILEHIFRYWLCDVHLPSKN